MIKWILVPQLLQLQCFCSTYCSTMLKSISSIVAVVDYIDLPLSNSGSGLNSEDWLQKNSFFCQSLIRYYTLINMKILGFLPIKMYMLTSTFALCTKKYARYLKQITNVIQSLLKI